MALEHHAILPFKHRRCSAPSIFSDNHLESCPIPKNLPFSSTEVSLYRLANDLVHDIRPPNDNTVRIARIVQRAMDLRVRYEQLGDIDDLNKAIVLNRAALSLCPPGDPDRSKPLSSLA